MCGHIERGGSPPTECPNCGAPFTAFQRQPRDPLAKFRRIELVEEREPGHRYVIVGNSAAGRAAVRAISALDEDGRITIISEEDAELYARPMLPDFIGGHDRGDLFEISEMFPGEGAEVLVGERAVAIDPQARQVECESGRTVPYESLLLATGSAPRKIDWPRSEADGIAYLRSLADAERIAELAEDASRAVVVGGGLLGLEFVRCFHMLGLSVTHLVRESWVGSSALDEEAGRIIEDALDDWGVHVALEEEVAAFIADEGRVRAVETSRGRRIEGDLVGVAVGAMPRTELAEQTGLDRGRGILVDDRFRSSAPGIYAAGDVAEAYDVVWDEPRVNTSWRNAQEQGEAAGIAMAGGRVAYPGSMGVNYQLAGGIPFCALGIAVPGDTDEFEAHLTSDRHARTYARHVLRDAGRRFERGAADRGPAPRRRRTDPEIRPAGEAPGTGRGSCRTPYSRGGSRGGIVHAQDDRGEPAGFLRR
ncbi:MAG: FAD-dependent oxidoreductase [Gemmatimonadota bacterium]|nr:FAD-dependent oxidoreductase [Gemmatimonadota bacterium]